MSPDNRQLPKKDESIKVRKPFDFEHFFYQVLAQNNCAVSEKPLVAKVTSIDTHFLSLIGTEVAISTLHRNKKLCSFTEFLLTY